MLTSVVDGGDDEDFGGSGGDAFVVGGVVVVGRIAVEGSLQGRLLLRD